MGLRTKHSASPTTAARLVPVASPPQDGSSQPEAAQAPTGLVLVQAPGPEEAGPDTLMGDIDGEELSDAAAANAESPPPDWCAEEETELTAAARNANRSRIAILESTVNLSKKCYGDTRRMPMPSKP